MSLEDRDASEQKGSQRYFQKAVKEYQLFNAKKELNEFLERTMLNNKVKKYSILF